jgi:tripeptide aminopeptidase
VGRSAHAGVEPEKGISAIEIAAKIINQLKLGRIDRETTYNIGIIHGGNVRNAVPDRVMFQGEIRSRNLKALEKILEQTERIFEKTQKDYPEAKIVLSLNKDFDGFKLSKNNPLIRRVSKVLRSMKIKPELKDSGGGSDANIFFTKDLEVVIVGTGVYEPHSTREYLVIPQMAEAANFCLNFLKEISTQR